MTEQNEINDRVQRGAALLDEKHPGWIDRIDLETLDVSNADLCVLGQLGGYPVLAVGLSLASGCLCNECAPALAAHGFTGQEEPSGAVFQSTFDELTAAWRQLIIGRRSEHAQELVSRGWMLSRDSLGVVSPGTGWCVAIEHFTSDSSGELTDSAKEMLAEPSSVATEG